MIHTNSCRATLTEYNAMEICMHHFHAWSKNSTLFLLVLPLLYTSKRNKETYCGMLWATNENQWKQKKANEHKGEHKKKKENKGKLLKTNENQWKQKKTKSNQADSYEYATTHKAVKHQEVLSL